MKKAKKFTRSGAILFSHLSMLLLLFTGPGLFAQATTVAGTVTAAPGGGPLEGVSVRVKDYPFHTTTDGRGNYHLSVPLNADSVTLIFSRGGLATAEKEVAGKAAVNISLEEAPFSPAAFQILPDFHLNKLKYLQAGLKGMAACHFTVAALADPQDFALCERLGLSVVVSEGPHLTGSDWQKLSPGQIDRYIKKLVKHGRTSRAIIGYYICDEPSATAFPALAEAVKAVKKYAPGKFAFINLYPNYATLWTMDRVKSQLGTRSYEEYLEKFVQIVHPQVISYDNYMVQFSTDMKDSAKGNSYYTNLLQVRKVALKYNLPFYNIVSSSQIRPFTTIPSPANLRFQAYTTLAAGARGLKWYTYHYGSYAYAPLDEHGNRTLTWRYLQEVNREVSVLGPVISGLTSTGVYFTSPAPRSSLPVLPGKWVQRVETDAPMMIGEFTSAGGAHYVMVVNLSMARSAKFKLVTRAPGEKKWIVSAAGNGRMIEIDPAKGCWLTAGQGVLIRCAGNRPQ